MQPPRLARSDLDHAHAIIGEGWELLRSARIFLTGGTGFVGKWLVSTLLDANRIRDLECRLTLLTRDPGRFHRDFPHLAGAPELELINGDVRDFPFINGKFTHVIHAAADVVAAASPLETLDACTVGTRRVMDQAVRSGASEVLLVSSGAVYGFQPPHIDALEESFLGAPDPMRGASAYGEGKRSAELLGSVYAEQTGLAVKTARCFAFVGPYLALDKHFAIGNFLRDALARRPIVIQGDGTPLRTYLHASDMAAWLWMILMRGRSQVAYNVGGSEPVSILELAHRVVKILASDSPIRALKERIPGSAIQRYVPNVDRIRAELELPAPWTLDQAIAATADWYKGENGPNN
jgi:nucleoside-diphosphate-sugar epimerase